MIKDEVININSNNFMVVGKTGQGKTSYLLELTKNVVRNKQDKKRPD
ncbi:TPA: hypothetical protein I3798_004776 [Enterobacter cloacae]|nr:hypothetical protein [Enterobacter cloacae]HAS1121321.1 hypothetical protein [Enterobacter cloacae]